MRQKTPKRWIVEHDRKWHEQHYNDDINEIKLIESTADASGLFELEVDLKLSSGHYLIKAVGLEGTLATSSFLVGNSGGSQGATIVATSVSPGETSDIYGSGFSVGEIISVVILNAENGSNRIVAGNETNLSGAFLSSVQIDLQEGLYTILAQGNLGSKLIVNWEVSENVVSENVLLTIK